MVSIVVARGRNGVIGAAGGLPWRLPGDLRRFRELTTGHAVVMGRRTWDSLPEAFRPLPGRRNLVVTSDPSRLAGVDGVEAFASLEAALDACGRECFVIGGGQVYEQATGLAERIYATEVDAAPDGDAFFPRLAEREWRCAEESEPVRENGHSYVFRLYERVG
jgi:dihydrofolate reductase